MVLQGTQNVLTHMNQLGEVGREGTVNMIRKELDTRLTQEQIKLRQVHVCSWHKLGKFFSSFSWIQLISLTLYFLLCTVPG